MSEIDKIYLKLIMIGCVRVRNLCDLGLYDEVRAEAEHLHKIPSLIGCGIAYPHFFYLRVHRCRFVDSMNEVAVPESLEHVKSVYDSLWRKLEYMVKNVFGEES